jgi:hypothetical protein
VIIADEIQRGDSTDSVQYTHQTHQLATWANTKPKTRKAAAHHATGLIESEVVTRITRG